MGESLGGKLRILFPPLSFGFYALGGAAVNAVAMKFNHYKFFIYLSLISVFISTFTYIYFLESPYFFYNKRDISGLYLNLLTICKRNFSSDEFPEAKKKLETKLKFGEYLKTESYKLLNKLDKENVPKEKREEKIIFDFDKIECLIEKEKKSKYQFLEFFSKKNIIIFFKLIFIFLQIQIIFGISLIVNKDLGISNIYLSGILVAFFQFFGNLIGTPIIKNYGRKSINICTAILITISSIIIIITDLISNHYTSYDKRPNAIRVFETGKDQ